MTNMITVDGSEGEGGGQMLRSSLTLSAITGTPVHFKNIRAGRAKPGLLKQHLTSARAAAEVCGGELVGDEQGAMELTLHPGRVSSGEYLFSVGSAGSAMLVLQTVLPLLLNTAGSSTLVLEGGTHNEWAPPYDFLVRSYLPLINRMGPQVNARIERYGFYPAGGGRVVVNVEPAAGLAGFDLLDAGRILNRRAVALVSNLPWEIGEREVARVARKLNWRKQDANVREVDSNGSGNAVMAEVECENVTAVFTSFGRRGVRAEKVADDLVKEVIRWQKGRIPVDEYLADQLLLPLALSAVQSTTSGVRRGGSFRTGPLSQHSLAHIDILTRFLDIKVRVDNDENSNVVVHVE